MTAIFQFIIDNLSNISWVLLVVIFIYSFLILVYDIVTKSDIEKSISYRGNDRIILGIAIFIFNLFLTFTIFSKELNDIYKQFGPFYTIATIILTAFLLTIIVIFSLGAVHVLSIILNWYPKYEVKLFDDKDDYWEIFKVTRKNKVIVKRGEYYIKLPSINELENKLIRKIKKQKRKKKKR